MSDVRVVSFAGLRRRLRNVLGEDSLLFSRFDRALANHDDALLSDVMDSLKLYPDETRQRVEEVMLGWLFDAGDSTDLADVETASEAKH
ncbi:MAG: hypothetical protein ACFB6S_16850 [Geminicoccaceae bacterium]